MVSHTKPGEFIAIVFRSKYSDVKPEKSPLPPTPKK